MKSSHIPAAMGGCGSNADIRVLSAISKICLQVENQAKRRVVNPAVEFKFSNYVKDSGV